MLAYLINWFERAAAVRRSRRALARLDDQMLKDIGISRADAMRESERPMWDFAGGARLGLSHGRDRPYESPPGRHSPFRL